jgi:hypothetical protein
MKKSLWLISLLWILILSWCWSSLNVVEYNDSFVALVKECTDANQSLFQTFNADWSAIDYIAASLQENVIICQNSQKKAADMWDYDKDSSLKDAVVDLLASEVDYLQKFWSTEKYRNIDNITPEDEAVYEDIVRDLYKSETDLNAKFVSLQEVQEAFAAKHWLKLE